ncbi:MAG: peptide ABC transporter substrate-binding protein, partial [bacterium]|nr:peptide ABC transporter substrate-binding protein [bacterium]
MSLFFLLSPFFCGVQANGWVLNNPYPATDSFKNIYYSSFNEQPKTLDPARAYSSNEYIFVGEIYEPLLTYDYFTRPYQLVPLTASELPNLRHLNKAGGVIPDNSPDRPAFSVYTLHLKKGILYQPHPALAKDAKGFYRYHHLSEDYLDTHAINQLSDFKYQGTRE